MHDARRQRRRVNRHRRDALPRDPRRPIVLRCPGPLVALRALAALYRTSPERLAACLAVCETRARNEAAATLRTAVSDALGSRPLTPAAVHYFHAARLLDPQLVLEHGLRPSPTTPAAISQRMGEVAASDGSRGALIRDVLLRPALYGRDDHLAIPAIVGDLAATGEPRLGSDLAARWHTATTPCIVEYRRHTARDSRDIDAALWFVAAALRGDVSAQAIGGHDTHRTPIRAHDIVSVRAIETQAEWTPER